MSEPGMEERRRALASQLDNLPRDPVPVATVLPHPDDANQFLLVLPLQFVDLPANAQAECAAAESGLAQLAVFGRYESFFAQKPPGGYQAFDAVLLDGDKPATIVAEYRGFLVRQTDGAELLIDTEAAKKRLTFLSRPGS